MSAGLLSEEARGTGALSGLRVLDLTKFWAGPAVTEALGNMGAQVVKVEAAHALDPWRLGGARQTVGASDDGPAYEFSSIFNAVNRNKYGLTLDLSQPRGRQILTQLLVTTDVLAENFAPRVMTKFGLGYESLRQINPRLVMISLSAFGSTGPWRSYVGFAYPAEQAVGSRISPAMPTANQCCGAGRPQMRSPACSAWSGCSPPSTEPGRPAKVSTWACRRSKHCRPSWDRP